MTQRFSYRRPATNKLPSAISHMGRIVRSMSTSNSLTSREIFDLAFSPGENYDSCKAILVMAQARDYVGKESARWPLRYCLTVKGAEIQKAMGLAAEGITR